MWSSARFYSRTTPFLIYFDDLPQSLSETASNLYADNTCIYYQQRDIQKIENVLGKEFSSLCEWFIDNKLSIHFGEDETKVILFTRNKAETKLNICFQDHSIKQYNCVEYFGCLLDNNLCRGSMARRALKKIIQTSRILKSCLQKTTLQCPYSVTFCLRLYMQLDSNPQPLSS